MKSSLDERLNQILPRLTSRDFLDSKGLGNEIGFWIFDYPPDREMDVRTFVTGTVVPTLAKHVPAIRAATVDLLKLVTEVLEERNLLDKAMDMQQKKGDDSALVALSVPVLAARLPSSGVPMNRRRSVPSLPAIGSEACHAAPHGWLSIQRSKTTAARGETRL